jgi:hypothetical protein
MNLKTTVVLAVILILLISYFFFSGRDNPGEHVAEPPDAWTLKEEFIERIEVRLPRQDKKISFLRSAEGGWYFDDLQKRPVDVRRWGGILSLLTGPRSKRQIASKIEDTAQFGLTDPRMVIILGVRSSRRRLEVLVGDRTPNEEHDYVQLRDHEAIYLVDRSWAAVFERLVTDPPLPPP